LDRLTVLLANHVARKLESESSATEFEPSKDLVSAAHAEVRPRQIKARGL